MDWPRQRPAKPGTPWFAWVHVYEPHFPYAPPEPFASRYRERAVLRRSGGGGRALGAAAQSMLDAHGAQPTLVVLTGDHGEALGEHGEMTHGLFAYEGTLRVPLIVYQPRLFAPRVVAAPVRHVDILPTILDALGAPLPAGARRRVTAARGTRRRGAAAARLLRVAVGVAQPRMGAAVTASRAAR